MKTSLFLVGAALLALNLSAQAQNRGNGRNNNGGNNGRNAGGNGANGGGALPLPEGVESVVSIDAYNILMAQTNRDGKRDLSPVIVRHVYSGGMAQLFGGGSIPTAQFVSPGDFGGGNGGNGGGGRTGFGNGGQTGGFQGGQNSGLGGIGSGFGGVQTGGLQGGIGQNAGNFGAFQMRPRSAFRGRN